MVNKELYEKIIQAQIENGRPNIEAIRTDLERHLDGKYIKMLCIKGETICSRGQLDDNIYFIERGKVIVTRRDMYSRDYTGVYYMPGEFFGFSALSNWTEVADYKALTNCNIYSMKASLIKQLMAGNEKGKDLLIDVLVNTIRSMTIRQSTMIMGGCRQNFVNFIMDHLRDYGKVDDDGNIVISLDVNLIDIAEVLNMTRETLSRIVSEMKKEKIIDTKRRYIKILDLGRFIA